MDVSETLYIRQELIVEIKKQLNELRKAINSLDLISLFKIYIIIISQMENAAPTGLMKAINWGFQKVKDSDRFATPVQLKYKGDSEFKTGIGGLSSIVMSIILLVYTLLLIKKMILKEGR